MDLHNTLLNTRIKKMSKKANIKSLNSLIYEEIRGQTKVFLEEFLRRIITVTQYYDKQTISVNHIYMAADSFLLIGKNKIPKCKELNNKMEICLEFPKTSFKKLLKQMVDDEKYRKPKTLHTSKFSYENVIIGDDASQLIQYYTEQYMLKILSKARIVMLNAKRQTLYPKDIKIVLEN